MGKKVTLKQAPRGMAEDYNDSPTQDVNCDGGTSPGYEYPSQLKVRNTFLGTAPDRPPSLEGFFQERGVRSAPVSLDNEDDAAALIAAAADVYQTGQPLSARGPARHPSVASTATPPRPASSGPKMPGVLPISPCRSPELESATDSLHAEPLAPNTYLNYQMSLRQPAFDYEAAFEEQFIIPPGIGDENLAVPYAYNPQGLGQTYQDGLGSIDFGLPMPALPGSQCGMNGYGVMATEPVFPSQHPAVAHQPAQAFKAVRSDYRSDYGLVEQLDRNNDGVDDGGDIPVLRLADALGYEPVLGSAELPTQGSAGHHVGNCKPCAFLEKGCASGINCQFCHMCPVDEKKRRKKEKLAFRRQMDRVQRFPDNMRFGFWS